MPPHPITTLLHAWNEDDHEARRHIRGERTDHSLQVTTVVSACYLRLANAQRVQ